MLQIEADQSDSNSGEEEKAFCGVIYINARRISTNSGRVQESTTGKSAKARGVYRDAGMHTLEISPEAVVCRVGLIAI